MNETSRTVRAYIEMSLEHALTNIETLASRARIPRTELRRSVYLAAHAFYAFRIVQAPVRRPRTVDLVDSHGGSVEDYARHIENRTRR